MVTYHSKCNHFIKTLEVETLQQSFDVRSVLWNKSNFITQPPLVSRHLRPVINESLLLHFTPSVLPVGHHEWRPRRAAEASGSVPLPVCEGGFSPPLIYHISLRVTKRVRAHVIARPFKCWIQINVGVNDGLNVFLHFQGQKGEKVS